MSGKDIAYLIILLLLLLLSGIFSMLDMAYSNVKRSRLEAEKEKGNARAGRALTLSDDYDLTISTVLFGNDFVNILASSLTSLLSRDLLEPVLGDLASTVSSLVLLAVLLIFGEILPKAVAKDQSYRIALHSTYFVQGLKFLFYPVVKSVSFLTSHVVSLFVKRTGEESKVVSDEELESMVDEIHDEGIIDQEQNVLIHRTIDFKETDCYEIMTPRVKLFGYDLKKPFSSFLKDPNCFSYSRVLVYDGDLDHIVGYFPVKTLLRILVKGETPDVKKILLPIVSVPGTMGVSDAILLMKQNHHHIAVVKDEFGGTDGIITMEDILEELVGEIYDEDDVALTPIRKLEEEGTYLAQGSVNIDDFFNKFGLDPDRLGNEYTTLNGFITSRLGRFPKVGDEVDYQSLSLSVIEAGPYTADLVLVFVNSEDLDEKTLRRRQVLKSRILERRKNRRIFASPLRNKRPLLPKKRKS